MSGNIVNGNLQSFLVNGSNPLQEPEVSNVQGPIMASVTLGKADKADGHDILYH